jgi:hypothetical protein
LHKENKTLLETLNVRIAERWGYIERPRKKLKSDPICMENIALTRKAVTEISGLTISALRGSFVLLVILLFCSVFVFLMEFVVFRRSKMSVGPQNVTTKVLTIEVEFLPSELETINSKCAAIFDEMGLKYRVSY